MRSEAYNRDCVSAMREMPDKAFDLAIVDPPYGIDMDGQEWNNTAVGKPSMKGYSVGDARPRY